ncbi:hypothetical protein [Rhodopirellula sp. UBA1907]
MTWHPANALAQSEAV